jgi:hypothetical protein
MLLPLTHPTDILMALFFGEVRPPPYLNFEAKREGGEGHGIEVFFLWSRVDL